MTVTVHLLAGLNGAGKTTHARHLERTVPAVRFTLDEWMIRLHGLDFHDDRYPAASARCQDLIWDLAGQVVRTGSSVVLDWNLWSRDRRSAASGRAADLGAECHLHHVDVPIETALRQATSRTDRHAHQLDAASIHHLQTLWEPPDPSEPRFTLHRVAAATPSGPGAG